MSAVLPISLTPPNSLHDLSIGFNAKSLAVENPTSAYWYLPDQLRFIAPFASGVILPRGGAQKISILYQAPQGLQQPTTPILPGSATFHFYEEALGVDSGVNLGGSSFGRSVSVIPFSCPPNTNTYIILPSGAPNGLEIQFAVGLGGVVWNDVQIILLDSNGILICPLHNYDIRGAGALATNPRYRGLVPAQSFVQMNFTASTFGLALNGSVLI